MWLITVDTDRCQGYANCVASAPDVFDIDDDGIVVLLRQSVAEDERERVEQAVGSCPVSALGIVDSPGDS